MTHGGRGPSVIVVHGTRVRGRGRSGRSHRIRPADARAFADGDRADGRSHQADAHATTSGRPATTTSRTRSATTRRRRRPTTTPASARRTAMRMPPTTRSSPFWDLQLAVRGDHHPAPEQGQGRRGRDSESRGDPSLLGGEHMAVPHREPCRCVRGERNGQVLPDHDAELPARRAVGRLPRRLRRRVREEAGRHEGVHPQRQGVVRRGRRRNHPAARSRRDRDRRRRGLGPEGIELHGPDEQDQVHGRRRRSSSAGSSPRTAVR